MVQIRQEIYKTIDVETKDGVRCVINAQDFDPNVHTKIGDEKANAAESTSEDTSGSSVPKKRKKAAKAEGTE